MTPTTLARADGAPGADPGAGPVAARCLGVSKRFGGTVALSDVSLEVATGIVHAFVGENGAGKSTCLGLLAGKHAPTSGLVEVLGHRLLGRGPREALRLGVTPVYQELSVVPGLTTVENAFLGREVTTAGRIDRRAMRERFGQACDALGIAIPPDRRIDELSVASAQMVEIIRGYVSDSRLLLFDEPTTSLSDEDRDRFYAVVGSLRARGVTQVLVSHNLDEVLANADVVTVFRDGRKEETRPAADWTKPQLISAMVGADYERRRPVADRIDPGLDDRPPALVVRNLRVGPGAAPVSLDVASGEIVGLAGLMGSGRSTILRSLAGANPMSTGSMAVGGRAVRWPTTVRRGRAAGIALLPEDRKAEGLLLDAPAEESLLLGGYEQGSRWGFLRKRELHQRASDVARRCKFDPERLGSRAETLSGGTQQKLLVGRWVYCPPAVLLADEPSRGVDVVARSEIWETLVDQCRRGMALLVASSEFEELIENCHRILVVAQGSVVAELSSSGGMTSERILQIVFDHARGIAGAVGEGGGRDG